MAATNKSGVGDGLGSDRAHLNPTTFPSLPPSIVARPLRGRWRSYARRFGIDKAAGRLKNWFGAIGSFKKGGLHALDVGGHGSDAVYTLTSKGKMAITSALRADPFLEARMKAAMAPARPVPLPSQPQPSQPSLSRPPPSRPSPSQPSPSQPSPSQPPPSQPSPRPKRTRTEAGITTAS